MRRIQKCFTMHATRVAVQSALIAMVMAQNAYADEGAGTGSEQSATELSKPTSKVELGIGYVSQDSFKAGEYNGLEDQGAHGIANIDLRGGDAYDSDGTLKWRIKADNLGLENRDISAEAGKQGSFRFNFGYDELLRNRSDTYQTPYLGAGSNTLTLPTNWLKPYIPQAGVKSGVAPLNFRALDPLTGTAPAVGLGTPAATVTTSATLGNLATLANIRAADLPAFHNVDLYTKRQKYDGGFSYIFDPQWEFKASMSHENKTGFKPISTVSKQNTEYAAVIPDLIDQDTDQYNVSLNYTSDKGFLKAAYYGSMFKNNVNSMTWQDPFNAGSTNQSVTMSSAPDNQFNQFGLTGGYNFTRSTKLVMSGSYARSTQNEAFLSGTQLGNMLPAGLPETSLNGLIETTAFDMKLTTKPITGLNLSGAYKYENRDNKTPVNTYAFYDANGAAGGSTSLFTYTNPLTGKTVNNDAINIEANRPYSKKVNQINLDADYNVFKSQWVKAGLDWQGIDRTCPGSWISCADADATKETTGRIEWHGNLADNVDGKIGYAYSHRAVNYNENAFLALVPMANLIPTGATVSAYSYMLSHNLTGFGSLAGYLNTSALGNQNIFFANNSALAKASYGSQNVISELIGMRRFNMSNRDRNKLRTSADWQVNDKLSLQGGFDFDYDNYDAAYGLKDSRNWALNLDGTYAVSENFSTNLFFNHEDQSSNMSSDAYGSNSNTGSATAGTVVGGCYNNILAKNNNAKMDQCLGWNSSSTNIVDTLGISFIRKNLMSSKLDLGGDLVFSHSRTMVDVSGGSYVLGVGAVAASGPYYYIPASNMPTVKTDTIELGLNGKYKISKVASVNMSYSFLHMSSNDYAYDGMQLGTSTIVMPTMEKAPSYNVHIIGATYVYSF